MDTLKIKLKDSFENDNSFVGFKIEDGISTIYFPHGFKFGRSEEISEEQKEDILLLMNTLHKLISTNKGIKSEVENKEKNQYPFFTAYELFKDYIENGYYSENEKKYTKSIHGKINWSKTIKKISPIFTDNSVIFTDFIVRANNINNEAIIRKIHKICLNDIYNILGMLFRNVNIEKEKILINKSNKNIFIQFLIKEKHNTYNNRKHKLIDMLITYILNSGIGEENRKIEYGTNDFEYVWQQLVDTRGISEKEDFYPVAGYYYFDNNEKNMQDKLQIKRLLPDTIMIENNTIFILDAKYYKIGTFPNQYDILKQIRYGEYCDNKIKLSKKYRKYKDYEIVNVFILPNSLEENEIEVKDFYATLEETNRKIKDKKEVKNYEKIYVVYIDTKSLLNNPNKILKKLSIELYKS